MYFVEWGPSKSHERISWAQNLGEAGNAQCRGCFQVESTKQKELAVWISSVCSLNNTANHVLTPIRDVNIIILEYLDKDYRVVRDAILQKNPTTITSTGRTTSCICSITVHQIPHFASVDHQRTWLCPLQTTFRRLWINLLLFSPAKNVFKFW